LSGSEWYQIENLGSDVLKPSSKFSFVDFVGSFALCADKVESSSAKFLAVSFSKEIYILLKYGHKDGYNCIKNYPRKRW